MRFPALHRALALGGAQVLTVPAAFTRPTGEAHWEILLRARAIETGSLRDAPRPRAVSTRTAAAPGAARSSSAPWGEVIGNLDHDEPGVLIADLDLARRRQGAFGHSGPKNALNSRVL